MFHDCRKNIFSKHDLCRRSIMYLIKNSITLHTAIMKKKILTKRLYEKFTGDEGICILVDRLWPRGMKKENAPFNLWMKEIAPSNELRKWYGHDPAKWEEFKKRYFKELENKNDLCLELISHKENKIMLLYGSKEENLNNAAALKLYLEKNFKDMIKV